jgi:hypothetical protein
MTAAKAESLSSTAMPFRITASVRQRDLAVEDASYSVYSSIGAKAGET